MATSGSQNFSVTGTEIITEALQICGVVPEGGTANTNQLSDSSRTLNMLIKNWQVKGYNLWTIKQAVIFPEIDKTQYKIGGSGPDHTCYMNDLVYTTVRTAYASGTTLEVTSTTGMTNSDAIGVVLDDGTLAWKTLTVVDTDTITLSGALASAAAAGNLVYTYTSKIPRPLRITDAFTRDMSSLTDTVIRVVSKQEYDQMSSKYNESSNVNQLYYDPQLDQGLVYLWPEPSDMTNLIYARVIRPVDDFDTIGTDTPDLPQEWYLPLAWNLAALLCTKYGVPMGDKQDIKATAASMLADTLAFDVEGNTSIFVGLEQG